MKKIVLLLSIILISGTLMPSFGQMENKDVHVHPATLGDRKPMMNFTVPEKIDTKQDFTLKITLYDEINKKNFQHVTIKLAIRNGTETPLINALFYDKNGQIEIDFKYQSFDKPKIVVQAPQETYLGGYMSEFGSRIVARQNVLVAGLYDIEATVISIDSPSQFIDKEIVFNKEIQIGEKGKDILEEINIPIWVRNNAKWWSNGEIDDKTFANGIQFMIGEGIIKIPTTENKETSKEVKIPDWIRNNAKWWSNGEIDDKTFANGIQYLVKIGIIHT
ncbi:MAG TPA: hypothetical protein VD699_02750 [Nitrosopumilaceae archaeon]|nr:hypothetical protein [Nitrosopumilaceae archaeon]